MRPFDPRLPAAVPAVRRPLAGLAGLAVLTGVVVIGQATTLATVLAAAAEGRFASGHLQGFVALIGLRGMLVWAQGTLAARAAATVKAGLRGELLAGVARRGPGWLSSQRAGEIATLSGRGLDALDAYFTGYLPQLMLAVTVPLAVLGRLAFADWSSALIVAVTLPLIPIFGALLGWQAEAATKRQWRRLTRLGGHFLDMVAGLPTLRAFGRAQAQVQAVREMADEHRSATMRTLRVAFLSSLVLELVATLSVALVAVPVGLRLLDGGITLALALLVLLLTPEAYLPLRTAGTRFHASMEGLTALDGALSITTAPGGANPEPAAPAQAAPPAGDGSVLAQADIGSAATADHRQAPSRGAATGPEALAGGGAAGRSTAPPSVRPVTETVGHALAGTVRSGDPLIVLDGVTVAYERAVALREVSLTVHAGERVALVGPSGGGKSTLLALLLGFVTPTAGRILVAGQDLAEMDLAQWRSQLAWVPQRPHLFATSLADNIRLGDPAAPLSTVEAAVRAAALDDVVAGLPDGLATRLGERGYGLSSGQRQRVALARAFLRDAPLLLLDEPTARLDGASEAAVLAATRQLTAGRAAILVAHRPALLELADRVVHVRDGRLSERGGPVLLGAAR